MTQHNTKYEYVLFDGANIALASSQYEVCSVDCRQRSYIIEREVCQVQNRELPIHLLLDSHAHIEYTGNSLP